MESAAIGGEMRIRKRVLVSCAVAKAGRPTKILVNSRTIRLTVMAVPNQGSTGGKGIWAAETKGEHFPSQRPELGLAGSEVLCTRGPCGLSLAPGVRSLRPGTACNIQE